MSDLKHKSVEELRVIVASTVSYRAEQERLWQRKEADAAELVEEAKQHRKRWHDAGQREAWARIYLAQKTTI